MLTIFEGRLLKEYRKTEIKSGEVHFGTNGQKLINIWEKQTQLRKSMIMYIKIKYEMK